MQKLLLDDSLKMSADIEVGSNGANAKSTPVTILAYTGKVVNYPRIGPLVFDLATMQTNLRIQLDYEHDDCDSIGYLNRFDITNNTITCKGAIVPFEDDKGAEVLFKLSEGVPYQASIWTRHFTMEPIDESETVTVNGQTLTGPLTVVRDWVLDEVAICKRGKDDDTSVALAASKAHDAKEIKKVLFVKATNTNKEGLTMNETDNTAVAVDATSKEVVEAPVAEAVDTAQAVEAKPVEADTVSEVKAEAKAVEAPVEVEADKAKEDEKPALAASAKTVETNESRKEFALFLSDFGPELAATYFAEGLSLSDATKKHNAVLRSENAELKKRLTAVDRGADKAIEFSATDEVKEAKPVASSLADVIRLANAKTAK